MVPSKPLVMQLKMLLSQVAVCVVLAHLLAPAHAAGTPSATKTESESSKSLAQEDEIRQVLMDLGAALSSRTASKAASVWSSDAVFIDQSGEQLKGKEAIQARFDQVFKERNASEVNLHPEKIKLLAPNVALVIGAVSRKTSTSHIPMTRFSLVLTKHGGVWLIDEATETAIQDVGAADHLKDLDWLVGNWQCNSGPDNLVMLEVEWGSKKTFLLSKTTKKNKGVVEVDRQIVGWDARTGKIVSWHFDCNGGFGYGKWTPDGKDSWIVDFAGVSPSGKSTRATNEFKAGSPTEFSWKSTQQSVDGDSLPDCGPIKLIKNKKMATEF